ncbi:MAG: hypothetical protein RL307_1563, partial [Pseudomonadota bacterium]
MLLPLIRRFSRVLLALGLVLASVAGHAGPKWQIMDRAFWIDASGNADFNQAKFASFTPYQGVLSQGYLSGALWVRFTVAPMAAPNPNPSSAHVAKGLPEALRPQPQAKMELLVHPTYLDDIEVYDELRPGEVLRGGQAKSLQAVQSGTLAHVFPIPASSTERRIWIRVKTQTTSILDVRLDVDRALGREEQLQNLLLDLLTASLLILSIVAVFYAFDRPSTLMSMFAVKQVTAFFYGSFILGYHRLLLQDWVSAETLAHATKWAIAFYALFSVQFHMTFFKPYRPKGWANRGLMLALVAGFLSCALVAMGWVTWGLIVNKLIALFLPIWLVVLILFGIDWDRLDAASGAVLLSKKVLLMVHLLMLIFLLMATLPTLGLEVTSFFALYASLVHGALTGLVLLFLVHRQVSLQADQSLRLAVASEKSLELERRHRERQVQFLSMLTHELRTPLSVLRLSLGTLVKADSSTGRHALQAIEDMNNLINRCNQLDQLEQGNQVAQFTRVRLSELVLEVIEKSPSFAGTHIQVERELFVWSDVMLLQTVLFNLIDNAHKYIKPGGLVSLEVSRVQLPGDKEERVMVQVINPLDPRSLPDPDRMFEKYYRSASAQQKS